MLSGKKTAFEVNRRVEWQLLLNSAKLKEAWEPYSKCGCFWKEHDQEKCKGVGKEEDNLWVTHGHYYLQVTDFLKRIVKGSKSKVQKPCLVCDMLVSHEWLERLRVAEYKPLIFLDCDIIMRPPMGPKEIIRLQEDLLLWIEEDKNGNPVVKSHMPLCCFCNRINPTHFPLECTHDWEDWEIQRYPCYRCKGDGVDHVAEECWVVGDREQTKEELEEGLQVWTEQIGFWLAGNVCPVCGESLKCN